MLCRSGKLSSVELLLFCEWLSGTPVCVCVCIHVEAAVIVLVLMMMVLLLLPRFYTRIMSNPPTVCAHRIGLRNAPNNSECEGCTANWLTVEWWVEMEMNAISLYWLLIDFLFVLIFHSFFSSFFSSSTACIWSWKKRNFFSFLIQVIFGFAFYFHRSQTCHIFQWMKGATWTLIAWTAQGYTYNHIYIYIHTGYKMVWSSKPHNHFSLHVWNFFLICYTEAL